MLEIGTKAPDFELKPYRKTREHSVTLNRLGYVFRDDISSDHEYIFERKSEK